MGSRPASTQVAAPMTYGFVAIWGDPQPHAGAPDVPCVTESQLGLLPPPLPLPPPFPPCPNKNVANMSLRERPSFGAQSGFVALEVAGGKLGGVTTGGVTLSGVMEGKS